VKRTLSKTDRGGRTLVAASVALVGATYGLVRLAYGLLLPAMQRDLGFDEVAAGVVSSAASVVYCVGALVGFAAAARAPVALVVAAGASACLGATGMAIAPDAWTAGSAAALSSAGAGLASPAIVELIRRRVSEPRVDRAQSIANAGTGPGLVAAGGLALALPDWRAAWVAAAVVTALATTAVLAAPRGAAPTRGADHGILPDRHWLAAHRRVVAVAVLAGAASAAGWTYAPSVIAASGLAGDVGALAWIAVGVGGAAVVVTAGPLSRLSPRAAWAATIGLMGAAIAVLGAGGPAAGTIAACVIFGWGYTAGTGALIAWTTRIDAAGAPRGTALLFIVLILGAGVGSTAVGLGIALVGSGAAFAAAAVAAMLAAASALPTSLPGARARR
jgi:predicted MFS family arabinose efflux permease